VRVFNSARSLPRLKPSWALCYSFPVRNSQSVFPQDVYYHACGVSVFDHILQRMQEKVRALDYVMTIHAEEEMEDDDLSILDVERAILTGEIIERQQDQEHRRAANTASCIRTIHRLRPYISNTSFPRSTAVPMTWTTSRSRASTAIFARAPIKSTWHGGPEGATRDVRYEGRCYTGNRPSRGTGYTLRRPWPRR